MHHYFLLFLLIALPFSISAQAEYQQIDDYLKLIQEEFSGESAYQTTEYVSERWRLPGNAGFDSSIYYVKNILEQAGFQASDKSDPNQMTYRIEHHPLRIPAWEPLDAEVQIVGETAPLLQFSSNRNMIAINSFSTPKEGFEAEVIYLPKCDEASLSKLDVKGKIVMAECHSRTLFSLAVQKFGAAGALSYRILHYNQPEKYIHSISFTSIPFNSEHQAWGVNLSYAAKERLMAALKKGPIRLKVNIQTKIAPADELTLIAEIPGQISPEERYVFSAHVQEPGANDNASGVGALAEMARVAAVLNKAKKINNAKTITFLWGDEIRATRRYIQEDQTRAANIRWGMSLDMVGEYTEKTGGSFLIEKMPDPSAIWTRGEDEHTEWGASPVTEEDFNPHYFNDIIEAICRRQAIGRNWQVKTNPFEGGSDHQPFLDASIPGLLLWHFTDVFYHTDADRIDKVSASTLTNVGTSALTSALLLCNGLEASAYDILSITNTAAHRRLATEVALSRLEIASGKPVKDELEILDSWRDWYVAALPTVSDVLVGAASVKLKKRIEKKVRKFAKVSQKNQKEIRK